MTACARGWGTRENSFSRAEAPRSSSRAIKTCQGKRTKQRLWTLRHFIRESGLFATFSRYPEGFPWALVVTLVNKSAFESKKQRKWLYRNFPRTLSSCFMLRDVL